MKDFLNPSTREYFVESMKNAGEWFDADLVEMHIAPELLQLVSKDIVETFHVVPVQIETVDNKEQLLLVTHSVLGFKNISKLTALLGHAIRLKMADDENVSRAILRYYGISIAVFLLEKVDTVNQEDDDLTDQEKSPVEAKVDALFASAISRKASDIHILPHDNGSFVRFRIDGRLIHMSAEHKIEKREKKEVVNIIKNKCEPRMDISNSLVPESGSFNIKYNGTIVDCRVATIPSKRGQNVVIRLLPTSREVVDFQRLGFLDKQIHDIKNEISKPSGLFLVAGLVGSGKSTTLYAAIDTFGGLASNTITIEDPVEIKNEMLVQVQVRETGDEKKRMDARLILKTTLRLDPDNILYGEVRDRYDAEICIQAAQTGHRVLSTLHAKNIVSALDRLFDLGISRASLLRELNCIVSQRLVGLLCPHCSEEYVPEPCSLLSDAELAYIRSGKPRRVGKGCYYCNDGYLGRTVVAEILCFDNYLRDFLKESRGIDETLALLQEKYKFQTMWQNSLALVHSGAVSLDEIIRVVGKLT